MISTKFNTDDQQNENILQQLLNQQQTCNGEITELKNIIIKQLNNQTTTNTNNELEQFRNINQRLQDRIIDLQTQIKSFSNPSNDPKIIHLEKIKQETIQQIETLKNQINLNIELETKIKALINNNINKFETNEELIMINKLETTLDNSIINISSLEISNIDIAFDKYNITINNNKLCIKLHNDLIPTPTPTPTPTPIPTITTEYYNLNINQDNIIQIEFITGLYTIDKLVEIINLALEDYQINCSYSPITSLIIFKSDVNFDIILEKDTLYYNLGFKSDQTNSSRYVGNQIFDLKPPKYLNLFLSDINDTKPIMQLTPNNLSKKILFNNPIKSLNKIQLKITDHLDRNYQLGSLTFSAELIIKSITNIKPVVIENESISISSDDIYSIIKSNIE
jgi:hypothetical protein